MTIVIPDMFKTRETSNREACTASLVWYTVKSGTLLHHYKYYPDNLQALITEGYVSEGSDKDPWSNVYNYQPKRRWFYNSK